MSRADAEQRIALLQARAQAQRLSAQMALLEAGEQLAPLRTAARLIGGTARVFSRASTGGSVAGWLGKAGREHPWLTSVAAAGVLRWVRRRPVALLLAAAGAGAAWWLLRPRDGRRTTAGTAEADTAAEAADAPRDER